MADKIKFRKLTASEIDCRVSTVSAKGCSLLLYKDARVDQNMLDETFGIFGWQRKHEVIDGQLFCTVSIKDPNTGEWVSKQDVGTESYTEKEKGRASDSFKRACFNLGIGRELYTAPFIWVSECDVQEKNNKWTTYDRFEVKDIDYDKSGNINSLTIINEKTKKVVYRMGNTTKAELTEKEMKEVEKQVVPESKINALVKKAEADGVSLATILDKCKKPNLESLTEKQFNWVVANWSKEFKGGEQS